MRRNLLTDSQAQKLVMTMPNSRTLPAVRAITSHVTISSTPGCDK